MKCKGCNLEKDIRDFHISKYVKKDGSVTAKKNGPCKDCKKRGIKLTERKSSFKDGMKWCKICSEYKSLDNYYLQDGKAVGYCKPCIKSEIYKKNKKRLKNINDDVKYIPVEEHPISEVEIEALKYIWKVKKRGGGIDLVDIYRIIHYSQLLTPKYKDVEDNYVEDNFKTIKNKWNDLLEWYEKNKELIL